MTMQNVTCYGTGVIGTAWGAVFLRGGCNVTFYDIDEEKLSATRTRLNGILDFFRSQGMMDEDQRVQALTRVCYTTDVAQAVSGADFIQENCPEDVALKQAVLAEIEAHCAPGAIIASSTSGLLISDIAAKAAHPERVIGGHPYNPAYVMPLVEISRSDITNDEVVAKAKAFYAALGKEPVVMNKECPGFLCNRIQMAVSREAYDLVNRGVCTVEEIDKAVVYGVGLRWAILGPHLVSHLGGGAGGFRAIAQHIGPSATMWLEDMAKWTKTPEGYVDIAEAGIAEEMSHRAPGTGQTSAELGAFLNGGIMSILKYHGKL